MVYYIYADDKKVFIDECKEYLAKQQMVYLPISKLGSLDIGKVSHFVVTGCLNDIKTLMQIAHNSGKSLGIIATKDQKELKKIFGLADKIEDCIKEALTPSKKKIDLLYCNGEIVLQGVVVGDVPPLESSDSVLQKKGYFERFKLFLHTLRRLRSLRHTDITLTDAKDNSYRISAVGLIGIEYANSTFASKLIKSKLSADDGRFFLIILSPVSIVQYIGYLFGSLVSHAAPKNIPKSLGYISSSKVTITPKEKMNVLIDAVPKQTASIELEVKQKALALGTTDEFWNRQNRQKGNKDSIKISHLPSDSESREYLSKSIPLFTHASEEQYASLFSTLREEGRIGYTFMVLLVLSAMIATLGLFIDSSSVIIGAMLLAPLMQPIVSLSMGVLRQDEDLEINGAKTIAIGVFFVLLTAAAITVMLPVERLTSEMSSRLSPTILDLFVAIVSGLAAAYAKNNEKILGSLAGVAIAVALVPPVAVAGIGLGWGDLSMFTSSFLLFVTNLVGIVFAAAFAFAVLGYSPLCVAKRGIAVWLLIVALVSIPLYASFSKMKEDIEIQKRLSHLSFSIGEHNVKLAHIELVHRFDMDEIRCEVISSGVLSAKEKQILKKRILKTIGKHVEIIVTFRYLL